MLLASLAGTKATGKMLELTIRWRASFTFMPSIRRRDGRESGSNAGDKDSAERRKMEGDPVMVPSGKYLWSDILFSELPGGSSL